MPIPKISRYMNYGQDGLALSAILTKSLRGKDHRHDLEQPCARLTAPNIRGNPSQPQNSLVIRAEPGQNNLSLREACASPLTSQHNLATKRPSEQPGLRFACSPLAGEPGDADKRSTSVFGLSHSLPFKDLMCPSNSELPACLRRYFYRYGLD